MWFKAKEQTGLTGVLVLIKGHLLKKLVSKSTLDTKWSPEFGKDTWSSLLK